MIRNLLGNNTKTLKERLMAKNSFPLEGEAHQAAPHPRDLRGLSSDEARRRLEAQGPNELPSERSRSVFVIALGVVKEPMFLMLVAGGGLYLIMGETADAAMLLGFVLVVMAITIIQERRTEKAIDALRDLSSPQALVIRDGLQRAVPGREVVVGDLVVLSEGDRVPADGVLRRGLNLTTDESLLTGESVPVRKAPSDGGEVMERPGGDDLSSVFSGTLVTAGQGVAEILATGRHSELGKIGRALQTVEPEATLLQQETRRLVRFFAIAALIACAFVVVTYAVVRGGGWEVWKQGLLAGVAMAMATLPEEFPVVLTVFLALGAWRIARSSVLTRRMPAIETLGAATVLCVDKTGTLTQNRMRLRVLSGPEAGVDLSEGEAELSGSISELLMTAILASKREPFDPMERALHDAADQRLRGTAKSRILLAFVREYPLSSELLAVTRVWRKEEGDDCLVASKGAPEAIAELCCLDSQARKDLSLKVESLAKKGLRVLAVARGAIGAVQLPDQHRDLELELVGLVGFEDPLRPDVPAAVEMCHTAGVRVVMITGDYPETALSIAQRAGLSVSQDVISGPELDSLTEEELQRRVATVQVFARVVPEQKLRIVNALKASGEIVAMTGDGVNDAPALKSAHIGIAMGSRGTDVAREASSLILLDDDFSSIVEAIRLGRRIFDNIKKAIAFILAVHVPIAGLSMIPVFFADWPLILLPIHIVFLELIIDPSCSLIFEAEEAEEGIMKRPPRSPGERLFSLKTVAVALLQGASVLGVCLAVYLLARLGHSEDVARGLTFATLVVSSVVIILVNRSWTKPALAMLRVPNTALRWVVGGAFVLLALVLLLPLGQRLFHFAPLHSGDLVLSLIAGLICVSWFELLKLRWRGRSEVRS